MVKFQHEKDSFAFSRSRAGRMRFRSKRFGVFTRNRKRTLLMPPMQQKEKNRFSPVFSNAQKEGRKGENKDILNLSDTKIRGERM